MFGCAIHEQHLALCAAAYAGLLTASVRAWSHRESADLVTALLPATCDAAGQLSAVSTMWAVLGWTPPRQLQMCSLSKSCRFQTVWQHSLLKVFCLLMLGKDNLYTVTGVTSIKKAT